jgi:DNA-binding transcriptional ArsR family regulator
LSKNDAAGEAREGESENVLKGTTLRVYRFMFKEGKPLRIHEIQRGLRLSSPSVAQYHLSKLLRAGLIRESESGYSVDRVVFGNLIRVRRMVLPFQITYAVVFAAALTVLLTVLRPSQLTSAYVFALVVIWIGLVTSLFESLRALKGL